VISWKQNFAAIWLAQFLSIMGFTFCLPFAPYYLQELGITDPVKLKLWVALFAAATPAGLAIFSPIWGAMADRFGRRPMMLRANVAGAVVLTLMGHVHSALMLVGLRLLQGMVTGTLTAAQTMVASLAPADRSGLALGTLSAAMFSGSMAGASLGGLFASHFGYARTFQAAGGILLLSSLIILLATEEQFERPAPAPGEDARWIRFRMPRLGHAWPLLFLILTMATARQFDMAFLPLLTQEIHGGLEGVSVWTGGLFAVGGLAGLLAGITLGRLADRASPQRIGMLSSAAAGAAMLVQGLSYTFALLFPARFAVMFAAGGLDPVLQSWLARITPPQRRGFVFGWAATARSAGWILAPLLSGVIASAFGLRAIFLAGALLFLALIFLIPRIRTSDIRSSRA